MDSLSVHFWFKIALFCILGHVQVLSQKNVGNLDFLTKMSYNIDQRSIIKNFLLQLSDMPRYINLNIYDNILIRDLRYPKSLVMTTQKVLEYWPQVTFHHHQHYDFPISRSRQNERMFESNLFFDVILLLLLLLGRLGVGLPRQPKDQHRRG